MSWEGHFSTVTTDQDPNKSQGRVLHPDLPRVLSEREVARAQGFQDTYKFHWHGPANRYRQIGNAVPPPLGRLLGLQILEAMMETSGESQLVGRRRKSLEDHGGSNLANKKSRRKDLIIDLTDLTDTEDEEEEDVPCS